MKIAILLYPTARIKIEEDSSFWIMWELCRRGHEVFYFESRHLSWIQGSPHANLSPARLHPRKGFLPSPYSKYSVNLASFDCIFIRKEPPFDESYLYALQLLDMIKDRVFILNDPEGIAMSNEKIFTLFFKNYVPETLVTENIKAAREFILKLKANVVIKPLNEKGGLGIFSTSHKDKNLPSLLDTTTRFGKERVLIQRFVPASVYGDKRILLLNGKILGAFLRKPPADDFRANLSVGGSMHKAGVSARDEKLVGELAPRLLRRGLFFVGIDVIGNYLTEVNVTSPAGIPEINLLNKTHLERAVVDFIESRR